MKEKGKLGLTKERIRRKVFPPSGFERMEEKDEGWRKKKDEGRQKMKEGKR